MEKVLVSRCLAGFSCRDDGGNNLVPEIRQLAENGFAVTACPEQLGGLPTPRIPSERVGDRVVNREGADVTAEFTAGAEAALQIALEHGCRTAILKSRSPSCGKGCIYNGKFSGELVPGNGVTADLLLQNGITVMTEEEYLAQVASEEASQ
ncbi:MAG: DUF523 domain-containing protein [Oscillospiraceae bacterium]|nr:DUF523 domain-containing protein [Oscillospiraceae bacterium]